MTRTGAPPLLFYRIARPISRGLFWVTILARAATLTLTVLLSFLVFAPVQSLLKRLAPRFSGFLPRLFYRIVLGLVNVRVVVRGPHPVAIPGLVVANHVSWTDIPALGSLFPAAFVAKSEIDDWPIVGTFARLVNCVFVDRGDRRSVQATNQAILARIAAGAHVVLFPEGTTHGGDPAPFHSAHFGVAEQFQAEGPAPAVQPIAIRYSAPHAAWIGDDALLPHVIGLMKNGPVTCEIIFCAPLALDRPLPRRVIAQECFDRIAAAYQGTPDPNTGVTPRPARAS